MLNVRLFLLLVTVFLSGCMSSYTKPYVPLLANQFELKKSKHATPIRLGKINDVERERTVYCRYGLMEKLPGNISFANYIGNALKKELQLSKLYSKDAKTQLNMRITNIQLNVGITTGSWIISARFYDHKQQGYDIISKYLFQSDFLGDKACNEATAAFSPAVQVFVNKLFQDSNFKKALM